MSFRKISIGQCDNRIVSIKCNPTLDIVALLLDNGQIDLCRFLNWKKIATLEPAKNLRLNASNDSEKIIEFEWSPNGKYIAIIYNGSFDKDKHCLINNIASNEISSINQDDSDNECYVCSVAVFDISSHEQVFHRNCLEKINKIVWALKKNPEPSDDEQARPLPHDTLEIPYIDLFASEKDFFSFLGYEYSKLKPEAKANKFQTMFRKTEKAVEMDLCKFEKEIFFKNQSNNGSFNIQTCISSSGSIEFYAFGIYRIMSLKLVDILRDNGFQHMIENFENEFEIEQHWNGTNIHELSIMLRNKSTKKRSILSLSLSILEERCQELFAFISLIFQIDLRAEFLDRSLQKMNEIWQDLCSSINRMLSDYLPKHKDENDDPIDIYSSSKRIKIEAKDFLQMMLWGNVSPELEKFLADMSEMDFKKLALNVEIYFVRLLKFNSEEIQCKLYHLLCFLNISKAIALEKYRFADLCLDVIEVNNFTRDVHAMLIKTTQMQKAICDSMKKLRSFIRWLSNCSLTYAKEPDSDTRLEQSLDDDEYFLLNSVLTNSDLHLVMEFLQDNSLTSGFRFPDVEFYLKAQPFNNNNNNSNNDYKIEDIISKAQNSDPKNKNIPYRIMVEERQKNNFFSDLESSGKKDEEDKSKYKGNDSNLDGSSMMMDITTGDTMTTDQTQNESIQQSKKPNDQKNLVMDFEDFEEFEQYFFNDNDDIDKYNAELYQHMSLYSHLVQIYDDFTQIFQVQTCNKLSLLQTELFKNDVDRVSLTELPSSFNKISRNFQQFYDPSQPCQFLANVCEKNRKLFVLQKDPESDEFNSFSLEFHFNDEQQRRVQLWIRDFKFFDCDILTLILSEFDDDTTQKNPQKAAEDYEDDVQKQQLSTIHQESGQFLLQIRFQSLYFATQAIDDSINTSNESNSSKPNPSKLDICLDTKINRKWLLGSEDEIVSENIELRELAKGTVNSVYTSNSRNIIAVVANSSTKVTFYDVADTEESDE